MSLCWNTCRKFRRERSYFMTVVLLLIFLQHDFVKTFNLSKYNMYRRWLAVVLFHLALTLLNSTLGKAHGWKRRCTSFFGKVASPSYITQFVSSLLLICKHYVTCCSSFCASHLTGLLLLQARFLRNSGSLRSASGQGCAVQLQSSAMHRRC